jgi:hypothetical protein
MARQSMSRACREGKGQYLFVEQVEGFEMHDDAGTIT